MGMGKRFKRWSKLGSSSTLDVVQASTSSVNIQPNSLPPGDQPVHTSGQKVSAMEVRELNELIRMRYALDIKIWSNRKCHECNRHLVEEDMRRADAALLRIQTLLNAWDNPESWKTAADFQRLREIKRRLALEGPRNWTANPPWEDEF